MYFFSLLESYLPIILFQNKYLCILVSAPFYINFLQWCRLCTFLVLLGKICIKFGSNLASKFKKNKQTATYNSAPWEEISEQH